MTSRKAKGWPPFRRGEEVVYRDPDGHVYTWTPGGWNRWHPVKCDLLDLSEEWPGEVCIVEP